MHSTAIWKPGVNKGHRIGQTRNLTYSFG